MTARDVNACRMTPDVSDFVFAEKSKVCEIYFCIVYVLYVPCMCVCMCLLCFGLLCYRYLVELYEY